MYKVAKLIEIESAHRLTKHPGPCRFIHGHTRKVEVVLSAKTLDKNDMVCDFKAVKAVLKHVIDKYDHSIFLNSNDKKTIDGLQHLKERVLIINNSDPTSEVLAKLIFNEINVYIKKSMEIVSNGNYYSLRDDMTLCRIRVWETSTSWVEYSGE